MASYEVLNGGKVRVLLCVNGKRKTKTFPNKQKAKSWARDTEYQLSKQRESIRESITQ